MNYYKSKSQSKSQSVFFFVGISRKKTQQYGGEAQTSSWEHTRWKKLQECW